MADGNDGQVRMRKVGLRSSPDESVFDALGFRYRLAPQRFNC